MANSLRMVGLVCAAILPFLLAPAQGAASGRPNILLVTVDTFRPDHLGYYGYPLDTSPHLDTLASEGVFFKQAFSSSGWTTPGLISILTSLYAPTHAVDIRGQRLNPGVETLPDVLAKAGYEVPDIFFLTEIPNFENLGFTKYARRNELIHDGDEILFHWLEEEADPARPFFLYYHYRDLHLPYAAGEPYESMFMPGAFASSMPLYSVFKRFIAREKIAMVKRNVMIERGNIDFAARDRPWVEALYDAEIRRLDTEFFGRLRRTLAKTGLDSNTVLVVSADHGEELLDRDLVGHISTFKEARLYDEITRIPLLMRLPGRLPAGRIVSEEVQGIDIMPTLLELADIPVPQQAQGHSLLPLIERRPWKAKPLYFESSSGGYTADADQYRRRIRAVRTERWKLIDNVWDGSYELYDLVTDSLELDNAIERYPVVADSLRSMLNEWVLYAQPRSYREPAAVAARPDTASWLGVPEILFPQDGDTLEYQGADHVVKLHWTGPSVGDYAIEYDVGVGTYHLAGEITESSSAPVYGPFQANFWNSLVLYNPWKFRVYLRDRPEAKSEWVEYHLAATGEGEAELNLGLLLLQAPAAFSGVLTNSYWLGWGLLRGMGDLYWLLASLGAVDLSAYALIAALFAGVMAPAYNRMGKERSKAWGCVVGYVAFVYSTIPVLPQVWGMLSEYTQGSVRYLGIAVVVVAGVGFVLAIWRRADGRRLRACLALGLIALAYAYLLDEFARFPAERMHLVEYGLMGYVLLRALRLDLRPLWAYSASFALAVCIGIGDECIQWVLPQRFFEVKDIELNAVSAMLGLLLARLVGEKKEGDGRA